MPSTILTQPRGITSAKTVIAQKPAIAPKEIFVVIPAYNEGRVIRETLYPLLALGYSLVVVDDGSSDNTYDQVSHLPVHLLRHAINLGQGAALQTGMTFALSLNAKAIVHFDADGQHPPDRIQELLTPILSNQYDVALGSRFLLPETISEIPTIKRWILKLGTFFTGITTRVWLTDTHNGLRAFSRDAASKILITQPRMAHASEIISQIGDLGLRYAEVPTRILYTEYAKQKGQSIFNALNIVIDLLLRNIFK